MDLGIRGKVAMVAAGSKGLGRAAALALAAEGCAVSVCGRSVDSLAAVKAELEALGGRALAVVADVAKAEDLIRWHEATEAALGPVDILITNTGGPKAATFADLSDEDWAAGVDSTLMNVVRMTRLVLPGMRARQWGRIVHITSLVAKQPYPLLTISSTLRAGLSGLTRTLALESARDGVTVNALLPGHIMTDRQLHLAEVKAKAEGKPALTPPRKPSEPRIDQNHPATLFNGKINPLIPYAIRGAIWYQGESNAGGEGAKSYGLQLQTLIIDWRARWGEGDFPFAYVQLPNFNSRGFWPYVREGMLKDLAIPHTGMAITIDVGNPTNVHPTNKQDPGHRLALWALGEVYGQKVPCTSGPLPAGRKVDGSTMVCSFTHTDGGLVAKAGDLKGFMLAGEDKKWVKADAKIVGETVVVSSPDVKVPAAVRYAWADNPDCNLYNGAGLPASPFRTDDWP